MMSSIVTTYDQFLTKNPSSSAVCMRPEKQIHTYVSTIRIQLKLLLNISRRGDVVTPPAHQVLEPSLSVQRQLKLQEK